MIFKNLLMKPLAIFLASLTIIFVGQNVIIPYPVSASETLKGAEKDYESFKDEMTKKYENLSYDFDQLKEKAKDKGSKITSNTIQEIDESREKIKMKMGEIKKDSKEQWKSMKKSLSESIDSLHSKIQNSLKN